jgi:sirohydrochlorin cobaltochelatase
MNDGEKTDELPAPEKRSQAILLVAHGSTKESETGYSTRRLRTELFYRNPHHAVEAAFWKEEPALDIALDNTEADDVYILPMLMSDGFFYRENFPAMIGIEATPERWQEVGRQRVFYDTPIGESPLLIEVLLDAIQTGDKLVEGDNPEEDKEPKIVLVGHGTPRSKRSTKEVYRRVDEIREKLPDRRISPAFIDDEPNLAELRERLQEPAIVIPWFIADGMHPRKDIPELLGMAERAPEQWHVESLNGHTVALAPAIGANSFFRAVVESAAREAFSQLAESPSGNADNSSHDPAAARAKLLQHVVNDGPVRFGAVTIKQRNDRFELTVSDEASAKSERTNPEAFEQQVLHLRTKHRPVPSAQKLYGAPAGFVTTDFYTVCHALETYYPGSIVQWARTEEGIPAESFGLYTSTLESRVSEKSDAPRETQAKAVGEVCERVCERVPIWFHQEREAARNLVCRAPCHAIYASDALADD